MVNWKYNKATNILEVTYSQKISPEDITTLKNYIRDNNNLPKRINILTDARTAEYEMKNIDLKELSSMIRYNIRPDVYIKNAFIHSKPVETAISTIIEMNINFDNYQQKVFSTKKAAISWLKQKE